MEGVDEYEGKNESEAIESFAREVTVSAMPNTRIVGSSMLVFSCLPSRNHMRVLLSRPLPILPPLPTSTHPTLRLRPWSIGITLQLSTNKTQPLDAINSQNLTLRQLLRRKDILPTPLSTHGPPLTTLIRPLRDTKLPHSSLIPLPHPFLPSPLRRPFTFLIILISTNNPRESRHISLDFLPAPPLPVEVSFSTLLQRRRPTMRKPHLLLRSSHMLTRLL